MGTELATSRSFCEAWWALRDPERRRISELLKCFKEIDESGAVVRACKEAAARRSHIPGFKWKTIYNSYKAWNENGRSWAACVREWAGRKSSLPPEFVKFAVPFLMKGNSGDNARQRVNELKRMWIRNEEIPGYGIPMEWWGANRPGVPFPKAYIEKRTFDFPPGWTYRNLVNLLPKHKAVQTLVRRGYHAAHGYLPQAYFDRSKLRPLERVTFDDIRLDVKVRAEVDGKPHLCYVNAIFALDIATGMILPAFCLKPRLKRDDETHVGLSRNETKEIVRRILSMPLPTDYKTTFLFENASATLDARDQEMLSAVLAERINIKHTDLEHRALLGECGFIERGGKPWMKGQIEAVYNLIRTMTNALPMATGNTYEGKPGDLEDKCKYTLRVLRAAEKDGVNPNGLWFPNMTYAQLHEILLEIVDCCNNRHDHSLQGFDSITEYLDPVSKRYYSREEVNYLNPDIVDALRPVAYPESPRQRFNRLARGVNFATLPPAALYPLFLRKKEVTVRNGRIEMSDKNFCFDKLIYPLPAEVAASGALERKTFTACVDDDRNRIHLWTNEEAPSYVGTLERIRRADMSDENAVLAEAGRVGREREVFYEAASKLKRDEAREILAGKAFNSARLPSLERETKDDESKEKIKLSQRQESRRERALRDAQAERFARQAAAARRIEGGEEIF